jgi:hypothetical protein
VSGIRSSWPKKKKTTTTGLLGRLDYLLSFTLKGDKSIKKKKPSQVKLKAVVQQEKLKRHERRSIHGCSSQLVKNEEREK